MILEQKTVDIPNNALLATCVRIVKTRFIKIENFQPNYKFHWQMFILKEPTVIYKLEILVHNVRRLVIWNNWCSKYKNIKSKCSFRSF